MSFDRRNHYFHFVFISHEKSNCFLAFKRVHKHSVILEYFSRVFRIFTRVFPPRTKFSISCFKTRVNRCGNETRLVIYEVQCSKSLVLIYYVAKITLSHLPREIKKERKKERSNVSIVCFITYRLYTAASRVLGPLSSLAAWDLSQSIFLCFCSPFWQAVYL